MSGIAGNLFIIARPLLTIGAIRSGRGVQRLFNIGVGRGLGRIGRRLWK